MNFESLTWNYTKKKANRRISNNGYRMLKDGIASRNLFLKQTEYIHSMLDVRCSSVSFSIKLFAFQTMGWAESLNVYILRGTATGPADRGIKI